MTPLILRLTDLYRHRACDMTERIEAFRDLHEVEPDDETPFSMWVDVTEVYDLVWALRCFGAVGDRIAVRFACSIARRALKVFEGWYPHEKSARVAVETAEKWLRGEASADECRRAWDAAEKATYPLVGRVAAYPILSAIVAAEQAARIQEGRVKLPGLPSDFAQDACNQAIEAFGHIRNELAERDIQRAELLAAVAEEVTP